MTTTPPVTLAANTERNWKPWCVAATSHFEVDDADGRVGVVQVRRKDFDVLTTFRFVGPAALADLRKKLGDDPANSSADIEKMISDATTFEALTETTDLASIPRFMRWFDDTYGRHTLAAIIHDRLIRDTPNAGALGSDTLSDRFFRNMLQAAGLPLFKRWIMWTAVALRSRWAAKGYRRATLVLWLVLASSGLSLGFYSAFTLNLALWLVAAVLPLVSGPLWGKQWGASLVAAVAVPWILPAAAVGLAGYWVYLGLERAIMAVGGPR